MFSRTEIKAVILRGNVCWKRYHPFQAFGPSNPCPAARRGVHPLTQSKSVELSRSPVQVKLHLNAASPGELHVLRIEGDPEGLLGFPPGDLLSGQVSLLNLVHSSDVNFLSDLLQLHRKGALRIRHADGKIRCFAAQMLGNPADQEAVLVLAPPDSPAAAEDWLSRDAYLHTLLLNLEEGAFLLDEHHVFRAASPEFLSRAAKLLGGRELVGLTFYDFLAEEDADRFYAREKQVLASGELWEGMIHVNLHDATHWIYARYRAVRSPDGQVEGLVAFTRNLTERIRAEESSDSAAMAEKLRPGTLTGTYLLDIDRGIFATSSVLEQLLGIDKSYPHDLSGWMNLVYPDDRAGMMEYLDSVLAVPGRLFNREYRIVRQNDGKVRWVQGIGRVDRNSAGKAVVMRGTLQDITPRKVIEAALKETSARLQLFIEHAPAALAMFDRDMRYLAVSRRWLELHSVSRDVIGQSHYEVSPWVSEAWREAHARGMAGEASRADQDRLVAPDGIPQWIRWEILPWRTAEGEVGGIVLFLENITEEKEAAERLQLAASVFEHATEGIMVLDLEARIVEVNDAFTRITGFERAEVMGQTPRFLRSPLQDESFYRDMWQVLLTVGRWRGEALSTAKGGREFAANVTLTTVRQPNGDPQYYVCLLWDITPIKEQALKLEQVEKHDALTGLPNRMLVAEKLRTAMEGALESGRALALIYIDLDNFKTINDRFGREASDQLLIALAGNLKRTLREGDTLGRLGGDEFVVILPEISATDAPGASVERLLGAATGPFSLDGETLTLTATAGATFFPQAQEVDADQLLRQADQAMYEAKLAGKARFQIFDPVQAWTLRGRHAELERIRQGLVAGEFQLYYQPKVNMATGSLIGAEALLRWQHPERGLLPPGLFLQVIEENDLAIEMGEWVMNTALSQLEEWQAQGHHIPVSVNVSARHLQSPDFLERLSGILRDHPNADPACLELELLETSTLQDMPQVSRIIDACHAKGMSIAIDDFGTGYSSLTYLKRLPANVLKIDQSFVTDMLDDPDDLSILQGVLGLATAFRRVPIAEGVETTEHGILLLKLGCQLAQGYGIARPMPAVNLPGWYAGWKTEPEWVGVQPISPFDWPLLVAEVEVRSWSRALERYLQGHRAAPPELDERKCRFGEWLEEEKSSRRGRSKAVETLEKLHAQSHKLARDAIQLHEQARHAQSADRLKEIAQVARQVNGILSSMYRLRPAEG